MKASLFKSLLVVLWLIGVSQIQLHSKECKNYKEFFDSFLSLKVDKNHAYKVKDFLLMQDVSTTLLDSGVVCFMEDIHDGKHIAIFQGHGTFEFTPPLEVERVNLKRHFGTDYYNTEFKAAAFIFDGNQFEKILNNSVKTTDVDWAEVEDLYDGMCNSVIIRSEDHIHFGVTQSILEKGISDFFFSEFFIDETTQYAWIFDPTYSEECGFYKADKEFDIREGYLQSIVSFECQEDLEIDEHKRLYYKQPFKITDIDVELDIYRANNYNTTSKLKIEAIEDFQWAKLYVHSYNEVISVKSDGKDISFDKVKPRVSSTLWITFPKVIKKGESVWITVKQSANLRGFYGCTGSDLYPVDNRAFDKKKFTFTIKASSDNETFAFGNKVHESELDDGRILTKWEYPDSLYQLGVIFENYKERTIESDQKPEEVTFKYTNISNLDMLETNFILANQFYSAVLGELNQDDLKIYELPVTEIFTTELARSYFSNHIDIVSHGKTSFEMGTFICNNILALAPDIFQDQGYGTIIQYVFDLGDFWFQDFEPQSNRDSWLLSGLRTFLVMNYVANFFEEKDIYNKIMDNYHTSFMNLDDVNKDFEDYGCLGLGNIGGAWLRAHSGAMSLKAFYFFHMLRHMCIDHQNGMSERVFMAVIKEFYQTYKNKKYSVNDFRAILEKYYGASLKWFFDEWVDGTDIPTYKFAARIEENEDGKYIVKCQLEQEDVPDNFGMLVPIKVEFDDGVFFMTRVVMQQKRKSFIMGPFDQEPDDVICNPNYSVLSNTKTTSWDDDFKE